MTNMNKPFTMMTTVYLGFVFTCSAMAFSIPTFRRSMMSSPNNFMDPSFSSGGHMNVAPQDPSRMQAMSLDVGQTQSRGVQGQVAMSGPPLGSGTQGKVNQVEVSTGEGSISQTGSVTNNKPMSQVSGSDPSRPIGATVLQGPQLQNAMNRPSAQVSGTLGSDSNSRQNEGIQQSVSGSFMFNPGRTGSMLQAPPGTGNSQFNNNIGSRNSMLNQFGGSGMSIDPSQFFRPKENPDGSISGAAGNAYGPPTVGPMAALSGGITNSKINDNTNNNNYNSMFGPPSFFMNPGSSFGQN